jgi:hypothetical protein
MSARTLIDDGAANLILSGVNRLDGALTALGCVLLDLNDDPEDDNASGIAALRWLFEMLEDEARNIRDCVAMAQGGRGRGPAAEPPEPTEVPRTIGTWQACIKPGPCPCPNPCTWVAAQVRGRGGAPGATHLAKPPAQA